MIVVADATPLRYLVLIDETDILPTLYDRILIPPAVLNELTQPRTPAKVQEWIAGLPGWLQVRAPLSPSPEFPATLGAGEREAITLAEELDAVVLLIDDWAGRREAEKRRIPTQGTLGLLSVAAEHGLTDLPRAIARLRETNFRADEKLIQSILDEDVRRRT
jgi:predicted nucleic acid-binding protein